MYPCIVVEGAGVECKIRIGEAVKWTGEGGTTEMAKLALGDKARAKKKSVAAGAAKAGSRKG